MNRQFQIALGMLTGLLLGACARSFEADVARFHQLPVDRAETVKLVPADADYHGSLEFEQYASLVRAELSGYGFRPVANDPDLIAELGWSLSEPRERVGSYGHGGHGLGHGGHGFGGHGFGGHGGHGFGGHGFGHGGHGFGGHGFGHGGYGGVFSTTIQDLTVSLTMQRPAGEVVFEGRANTTVEGGADLPAVMPYMTQALFTDFPGISGRTRTVELKLADEASTRAY